MIEHINFMSAKYIKIKRECTYQHVHHIFPLSRNSTMNGSLADSAEFGEPLPSYYTSHPVEAERDANALIHSYIDENLAIVRRGKIAQPVCLPQIERGFDMPFARGYAPALEEVGISQDVFLDFLDGLNTALIASPPLQVVDFAGLVISFVYVHARQSLSQPTNSTSRPHEIFFFIGASIRVSAQIGMRVLSKTLTDRYMRAANERIFVPAGLRVRICKAPAMRALAKVPWVDEPRPSRMKRLAETMSKVYLWKAPSLPPVQNRVDPRISDPLVRRMMPYEGYVLPMTSDVPPPKSAICRE